MSVDLDRAADSLRDILPDLIEPDRGTRTGAAARLILVSVAIGLFAVLVGPSLAFHSGLVPDSIATPPAAAETDPAKKAVRDAAQGLALPGKTLVLIAALMLGLPALAATGYFQFRLGWRVWNGALAAVSDPELQARTSGAAPELLTARRRWFAARMLLALGALVAAVVVVALAPRAAGPRAALDETALLLLGALGVAFAVFLVLALITRVPPAVPGVMRQAPAQTAVLGLVAAAISVSLLPGPWDFGALAPVAAEAGRWPLGAAVLAIAFLAAIVAVTAFACRAVARNYPEPIRVEIALDSAGLTDPELLKQLPELCEALQEKLAHNAPAPAAVNPRLPAKDAMVLIESMMRALAGAMIVALLMLSLGLDLAVARLGLAGDMAEAAQSFAQALLYLAGAGFTLALAAACGGPMIRVDPYVEAYAAADKAVENYRKEHCASPRREWCIRLAGPGDWALSGMVAEGPCDEGADEGTGKDMADLQAAIAARIATTNLLFSIGLGGDTLDQGPPEERRIAQRLGADSRRIGAILAVPGFGGSFHTLTQQSLAKRLAQLATLLAPAMASGVLGLLG